MKLLWPSLNQNARITQAFGLPAFKTNDYYKIHNGVDIAFKTGEEVISSGAGKASVYWADPGYGNYIKIFHNSLGHTLYAHLNKVNVKAGEKVVFPQVLIFTGDSRSRENGATP